MASVTITNYNSATGCVSFNIVNNPNSSPETTVVFYTSTDGINFYSAGLWDATVSPKCGIFFAVQTWFYLRLYDGTKSNTVIYAIPIEDPLTRTVISSPNQITFVNSPVHIDVQNTALDSTIRQAKLQLWIWSGAQNKSLGNPNHTFIKDSVSLNDNYISFEISDMIKAFLQDPNMNNNSDQPGFGYNVNALPAVSGLGVFWQIRASVVSTTGTEVIEYPTNFATLGYRWNYQQDGISDNNNEQYGSLGFSKPVVKWYNPNVPKYFKQDFVFSQAIETCTSSSMVSTTVETKTRTRCTRDSSLIVYLDHRGLWDVFTPHGKIITGGKIESSFSNRVFRRPNKVNNNISHSKLRNSIDIEQSYIINTGSIDESEVQRIEELIYSPKIYLIKFLGDVVTEIVDGLTIDSTFVTIDDTDITIDNTPIVVEQVPYFSTFQQIPVTIEDENFVRKTLMNNKTAIDYSIKLVETTSKINNQR